MAIVHKHPSTDSTSLKKPQNTTETVSLYSAALDLHNQSSTSTNTSTNAPNQCETEETLCQPVTISNVSNAC